MTNPPTITINGNALKTVPTFKYLVLLFTSDLSWSQVSDVFAILGQHAQEVYHHIASYGFLVYPCEILLHCSMC